MNISVARFQNIHEVKKNGVTYTPIELAEFLAKRAISYLDIKKLKYKKIKILDPSIGDGILIIELLRNLELMNFNKIEIVGIDIDDSNFLKIKSLILNSYPNVNLNLYKNDFLEFYDTNRENFFDIIVANPPYIRTQIIGGEKSQKISKDFKLKGKTDIYYAFMMAISNLLSPNGISATITSNRFLSIKSGQVLRDFLLDTLDIKSVYDLGDTKLFSSAAVLPALVFSKRKGSGISENPEFTTIYEIKKSNQDHKEVNSIFSELLDNDSAYIKVGKYNFEIVRGNLNLSKSRNNVWAVSTEINNAWLSKVTTNTWKIFKDIGPIRVGVKSTADKVFIRDDWSTFDSKPELLRYLLTSQCAHQFKAIVPKKPKEIIYPHISQDGKKGAVNLEDFPFTKNYLEKHKDQLSSREYLIKAGRNWYELWVPQNPNLWCKPKIVFPDISEKPKFWIDLEENIVNGECYWFTPDHEQDVELLWLCLAIANSKFIEIFYDYKFNNKLYSGKRRFMKQYVEEFPIPDPELENSQELIKLSKMIYAEADQERVLQLKDKLDELVFKAFEVN